MRIYPESYGDSPEYPTTETVQVCGVDGKGEGVITLRDIPEGGIAFRFTGPVLPYQTLFTLQLTESLFVEDPFVMGKSLHSCEPNCKADMTTLTFIALRDIKAGELLTIDYEDTEDHLYRDFQCGCGAATCRGLISGRKSTKEV